MQFHIVARLGAVALVLTCSGCGGGSSGSPNAPTTSPPPAGGPSTIAIVGDRGAQSFSPNPGSAGQNQMVVWRNNDNVTHRIVLNDGTIDTGDIAPGATTSREATFQRWRQLSLLDPSGDGWLCHGQQRSAPAAVHRDLLLEATSSTRSMLSV